MCSHAMSLDVTTPAFSRQNRKEPSQNLDLGRERHAIDVFTPRRDVIRSIRVIDAPAETCSAITLNATLPTFLHRVTTTPPTVYRL